MTLRRNGLGQLGFHVRLDGTVAEVPLPPARPPHAAHCSRDSSIPVAVLRNSRRAAPLAAAGGGVRLRLAGRTEAGQPAGGDLQGGRRDADPRADDRPAEDLGDGQGGHHSSLRGGRTPQVRARPRVLSHEAAPAGQLGLYGSSWSAGELPCTINYAQPNIGLGKTTHT